MSRVRGHEWQLFADYGQGWELVTTEETSYEIRARFREYRENAPQYQYKIKLAPEDGQ